jgi:ribonuclease HI
MVDKWQRPERDWIKMNWDAALTHEEGKVGLGIVARDESGSVVVALCCFRPGSIDSTFVEALGAWKMAEFCARLGYSKVVIEGDSLEVINALSHSTDYWGRYRHLVDDAKLLLNRACQWKATHVKRTGNEVAHRLAKYALTCNEELIWHFECPSCIQDVIVSDLQLLD